jgi:hypothetical protein
LGQVNGLTTPKVGMICDDLKRRAAKKMCAKKYMVDLMRQI